MNRTGFAALKGGYCRALRLEIISGRPGESGPLPAKFHFVSRAKDTHGDTQRYTYFTGFTCTRGATSVGSQVGSGLVNYLEQEESYSGGLFLR